MPTKKTAKQKPKSVKASPRELAALRSDDIPARAGKRAVSGKD